MQELVLPLDNNLIFNRKTIPEAGDFDQINLENYDGNNI